MSPANGPFPLPAEPFGSSALAELPSGLFTFPRAESSALLMYCSPVATLYNVNTRCADTRLAGDAPAPATDTEANTNPTATATTRAALRRGGLAPAPRRDITAESGGLSLRRLIRPSLPHPYESEAARPGRSEPVVPVTDEADGHRLGDRMADAQVQRSACRRPQGSCCCRRQTPSASGNGRPSRASRALASPGAGV
jgi:hypothetical protein